MAIELDPRGLDRVRDAIRRAEALTSGEIVCMVVRSSRGFVWTPGWFIAGLLALLSPYPFLLLSRLPALDISLFQWVVLAVAGLFLAHGLPRMGWVAPPDAVRRCALRAFNVRGLADTARRNGVLIYLSLAERKVELVADTGLAPHIGPADWDGVVADIAGAMRGDALADALVVAIDRCASLMAVPFPAQSGDRNELPDLIFDV